MELRSATTNPSVETTAIHQGFTHSVELIHPTINPKPEKEGVMAFHSASRLPTFDEVAEAARMACMEEILENPQPEPSQALHDWPVEVAEGRALTASEDAQETLEAHAMVAFKAAMVARNLIPPVEILVDGIRHRCDVRGSRGEGDGTYWLSFDGIPTGGIQNWKDGRSWQSWSFETGLAETISQEEMEERREKLVENRLEREMEDRADALEAEHMAKLIWGSTSPCTEHPYLARKGVKPYGVRIASRGFRKGSLVIPAMDMTGAIHTVQFINEAGEKHFLKGGKKKGCCFPIGKPKEAIFVAEGYATAATIHEATGEAVVVAFDAGNLKSVAEGLHATLPDYPIIIAADDDYTREENPGITKAMAAAEAVGGRAVVPDFGADRPDGATDFNDLAKVQGLDKVLECLQAQLNGPEIREDRVPRIYLTNRSEHEIVTEALGILADQELVFVRGEQLVHVSAPAAEAERAGAGTPTILPATPAWMRLELSRVAAFYKEDSKGRSARSLVPDWVSKLALEMVGNQKLQNLLTLAETPVVLKDGAIHSTSGFDPSTGIFYAPLGGCPALPEVLTKEDAVKAAEKLFELVADFPFATEASKAGWLALLLTIPARFAIPGPVPFWLIDANGQSAGKGLLTHITSIITLGRDPVAMVGSRDPEEFRKNVLCVLMNGTRLGWMDEAENPFGGRQWNGLITATTFQDRILGASKTWSGPHYTVWVVTGNNVQLASDTPRRCVHIRLEPAEERPEERGGFKIPNILAHTKKHREEMFHHLLVILRAYHLAGRPSHELTPWGSFEDWSSLIRECVYWCTGIDCDTRKELTATADPTRGMAGVILDHLQNLFPSQRPFMASDVLKEYESREANGQWTHPELREALDTLNTNPRGLNSKSLGNLLKNRRDRNFNNLVLKGVAGGKQGMVYRVINVGSDLPAPSGTVLPLNILGEIGAYSTLDFFRSESQVPKVATSVDLGLGETGASGAPGSPRPGEQTA